MDLSSSPVIIHDNRSQPPRADRIDNHNMLNGNANGNSECDESEDLENGNSNLIHSESRVNGTGTFGSVGNVGSAEPTENGNVDDETKDISDEHELEELAKLRCQSVATEVVAARLRRRCSDYPGFAFGSSIFSSNTLMKFSIIKNELHNIMNVQLKRVSQPL